MVSIDNKFLKEHFDGKILRRLGKTFSTENKYYYYDTGTGKIAEISYVIYMILTELLKGNFYTSEILLNIDQHEIDEALEQIENAIREEHILSAPPLLSFNTINDSDLKELLMYDMSMLMLEVSEKCNLRCKYCIYQSSHEDYRNFGEKDMSWDTAKKALDYFLQHSINSQDMTVSFYGGEPLINYPLIQKCVDYVESFANKENRKVSFSMTTNATLVTDEIAEFLAIHDFNLSISVDGSEKMHNKNRIFKNGQGSYEKMMQGLFKIINSRKKLNKSDEALIFNMVIDSTNYKETFDEIQAFLREHSWFPKNLQVLSSPVEYSPKTEKYIQPNSEEEHLLLKGKVSPINYWTDEKLKRGEKNLFSEKDIEKDLARIHKRFTSDKPDGIYGLNGCCIPGKRRVYVSCDGNFYLCEKVGYTPPIGNVDKGFDLDIIKKVYIDDFAQKAQEFCKECWAVNLCGLCYHNSMDLNGVRMDYRHADCVSERFALEDTLIRYHKILEEEPEKIKELDSYELT